MNLISESLSLYRNKDSEFKRLYTLYLLDKELSTKINEMNELITNDDLSDKVEVINEHLGDNNYLRDLFLDLVKCLEIIEYKKIYLEGFTIKKNKCDMKIYPEYIYDNSTNMIKIKTNNNIQSVDEIVSLINLLDKKLPEVRRKSCERVLKL